MNRAVLLLDDAHNANSEYDWLSQSDPRKRLVRGIHPNLLLAEAATSSVGFTDANMVSRHPHS